MRASQPKKQFSGHTWKHQGTSVLSGEEDAVLGQGRPAGPGAHGVAVTVFVSAGRSLRVKGAGGRHVCSLPAVTHAPQILSICGESPGGRLCLLRERRGREQSAPVTPDSHRAGRAHPPACAGAPAAGSVRGAGPAPHLPSLVWGGGRQGQADSAGVGEGTPAHGLRSLCLIFRSESVG